MLKKQKRVSGDPSGCSTTVIVSVFLFCELSDSGSKRLLSIRGVHDPLKSVQSHGDFFLTSTAIVFVF